MVRWRMGVLAALVLTLLAPTLVEGAQARAKNGAEFPGNGLAGATIFLIRHAEKPLEGSGLTPQGEARARAYARYFTHFSPDGAPVHIDALIATADTAGSARPRLTLTPLSQATGLTIAQPFADDEVKALARSLAEGPGGRTILIAWHHGKLPKLIDALGADPDSLLPGGVWPSDVYDWVLELRYDASGHLAVSRRIVEPSDLVKG